LHENAIGGHLSLPYLTRDRHFIIPHPGTLRALRHRTGSCAIRVSLMEVAIFGSCIEGVVVQATYQRWRFTRYETRLRTAVIPVGRNGWHHVL
jgi:hypothetical protein